MQDKTRDEILAETRRMSGIDDPLPPPKRKRKRGCMMTACLYASVGMLLCLVPSLFFPMSESDKQILYPEIAMLLAIAAACYFFDEEWFARGKQRDAENAAVRKAEADLRNTIVKAAIIGVDSRMKTGSAAGRAIVGDFLAGPVGGFVGASTSKRKGYTKFLVEYADGHKTVEDVRDNSSRFNLLIQFVDIR